MNIEQRILAAVMLTDICGYTRLVEHDEKLALELLEEHNQLLRLLFSRHGGREVKSLGDGFLAEFSSALQATQCAVDIQKALVERNASSPSSRRIQVRIGLHLGDVVHQADDVFGDGVNVVSRIEPLAEPGGVCISRQVYDQVWNKIEMDLESLGKKDLKNVQHPVEIFRVVFPWQKEGSARTFSSDRLSGLDPLHALGLSHELLEDPQYGVLIERLLRRSRLDPSVQQLIRAWLENTAEFLEGVDVNQFDVKLEDIRTYAGRFLQLVEEGDEVFCINYIYTPIWWGTELGENYTLHKINASRRGADIHQVFIEPNPESLEADRQLIDRLVGPHSDKGGLRIYGIAEAAVVKELRLDLFLVKSKLAFKNDLEGRTWLKGFELYLAPSEGLARLEENCGELMTHDALVEYDPNHLYGGIENFDDFVQEVFRS
jgi:class 3 adenylate cyclase